MAALVHNLGLELPVFSNDDPRIVRTKSALREAAYFGGTNVIRYINFGKPVDATLQGHLRLADEVFEEVANLCKAEVIPHIWGLIRRSYDSDRVRFWKDDSPILPKGYSLAAEVSLVHPVFDYPIPDKPSLLNGLDEYRRLGRRVKWTDSGPSQFVITHAGLPEEKVWLVDIEPHLTTS